MQERTNSVFRVWLINAGLVLVILCVLYVWLTPIGHRGPSDRPRCRNNLKQISLAMHNYLAEHGHLPPAYTLDEEGNRLHSWRTLLLPHSDQQALYDSIDLTKPWYDPANAKAYNTTVEHYRCPLAKGVPKQHTTYLAITGEFFAGDGEGSRKQLPPKPSQQPAFVEVPSNHAVHWMAPEDISPTELLRICDSWGSTHRGKIPVSMFDASQYELPPDELKELLLQER